MPTNTTADHQMGIHQDPKAGVEWQILQYLRDMVVLGIRVLVG